jgi:cytochrome c-type biogenesis protein CcmH/NrfG
VFTARQKWALLTGEPFFNILRAFEPIFSEEIFVKAFLVVVALLFVGIASSVASAQGMSEACGDSSGSNWATDPAVYGRVTLQGFQGQKFPKLTVTLIDRNRNEQRYTLDRNGYYCFRGADGSGGTIIIDIEGNEAERRSLGSSTSQLRQHRQDFDISVADTPQKVATISAKFAYPRDAANSALFDNAAAAEQKKDSVAAIKLLRELLGNDPRDFVAWAKLGSIYFESNDLVASEKAYVESARVKPDFSYAFMNLGRIYLAKGDPEVATKFLERATQLEPGSPRAFQLLGEAYILVKKGTLGVEALNEAIRLDPVGMADSHLLIATLYDRAGAKSYASREYKLFLEKKPDHTDRKKFEKYIKENPPESN